MKARNRDSQVRAWREQTRPDRTVLTVKARSDERLLQACASIDRLLVGHQSPSRERLEARLGKELTRVLLAELTPSSHQMRAAAPRSAA